MVTPGVIYRGGNLPPKPSPGGKVDFSSRRRRAKKTDEERRNLIHGKKPMQMQNLSITARIPHQSKNGSDEPFFASFPPGEAFTPQGAKVYQLTESNWAWYSRR